MATIKVNITKVNYPVSAEVIRQVFAPVAPVTNANVMPANPDGSVTAYLSFPSMGQAQHAMHERNDRCIYQDCNHMSISMAQNQQHGGGQQQPQQALLPAPPPQLQQQPQMQQPQQPQQQQMMPQQMMPQMPMGGMMQGMHPMMGGMMMPGMAPMMPGMQPPMPGMMIQTQPQGPAPQYGAQRGRGNFSDAGSRGRGGFPQQAGYGGGGNDFNQGGADFQGGGRGRGGRGGRGGFDGGFGDRGGRGGFGQGQGPERNSQTQYVSLNNCQEEVPLQRLFELLECFGGVEWLKRNAAPKRQIVTVKMCSINDAHSVSRVMYRVPLYGPANLQGKLFANYVERNAVDSQGDPNDSSVTEYNFTNSKHRTPAERTARTVGVTDTVTVHGVSYKTDLEIYQFFQERDCNPETITRDVDVSTILFSSKDGAVKAVVEFNNRVLDEQNSVLKFAPSKSTREAVEGGETNNNNNVGNGNDNNNAANDAE